MISLGYFITSKAYKVYNKRTIEIEESMHVMFDETNDLFLSKPLDEDDDLIKQAQQENSKEQAILNE